MIWVLLVAGLASAADFREVAKKTAPSIATLEVRLEDGEAAASGFVIEDGTILVTNYHVIDGATDIIASFDDGDRLVATGVIAADREGDLALVRLSDKHPALAFGDRPDVGAPVLAVGNPQGLGLSFTDGILSGSHDRNGYSVLQHSAPISPGNSGGPLLDEAGAVVGVNSFHLANTYGQNVNFAVSAANIQSLIASARGEIDSGSFHPFTEHGGLSFDARDDAIRRKDLGTAQIACNSPDEPKWPFETEVKLWDMAEVAPVADGVCRHAVKGDSDFFYARLEAPTASDALLEGEAVRVGYQGIGREGCTGQFERELKPGDREISLVVTRHRSHLLLYAEIAPGNGQVTDRIKGLFCRELDKLRNAARP